MKSEKSGEGKYTIHLIVDSISDITQEEAVKPGREMLMLPG